MKPVLEQHYSSDSIWRDPRRFTVELTADLRQCPELTWQLFLRNIRARYRQSITGYVWAFVPPLAWAGLFLVLRSAGQVEASTGRTYAAYVITGLVFWQVFIESAQMPLRLFAEARPMLAKLRFPREALIAAGLLEVGLQFLVRLPLLIIAWFLTPGATPDGWWLLPASLAGLIGAGCFVGIALLPFSLLYQDVAQAFALASGFWLLVTPVGYAVPSQGLAATLTAWNPAAVLVTTARAWWLGIGTAAEGNFAIVAIASTCCAVVAWCVARVAFPHLIARFGS